MLDDVISVDIGNLDYPALAALRERIDEKVREMREVGARPCARSSPRKLQLSG